MSSILKKTRNDARRAKLPARHEAKRRRLIARLRSFGQDGNMNETIKTLRKRLHPFVAKPKFKLEDYRTTLLTYIRSTDENYKSKFKDTKHKHKRPFKNNRKSSKKLLSK